MLVFTSYPILGAAGEDGGTSDCSLTHGTRRMTEANGEGFERTTGYRLIYDGRWADVRLTMG